MERTNAWLGQFRRLLVRHEHLLSIYYAFFFLGARVVFDPVDGDYINTLAQATANGGTIFLYGMLSGKPTPFPMAAFGRTVGMFGYTFGELRGTPEWKTRMKYIYDHLADGSFKPVIARTFPFDQTVDAYRYLESNEQIGKVVVTL